MLAVFKVSNGKLKISHKEDSVITFSAVTMAMGYFAVGIT